MMLGIDRSKREAIILGVDDKDGMALMQMWGEKDGTAERAGFALTRDGATLMKVSNESGFERFVLRTQGADSAAYLIGDPKAGAFKDVLPTLAGAP